MPDFHALSTNCQCQTIPEKFKSLNTPHLITTNPEFLRNDYPILYNLCKHGAKYRVQTKQVKPEEIYSAITSFCHSLERKYGANDNELHSYCLLLKHLLKPLLTNLHQDPITNLKRELTQAHSRFMITLVDKDAAGIAFVCHQVAATLTRSFIYGPKLNHKGLFQRDPQTL